VTYIFRQRLFLQLQLLGFAAPALAVIAAVSFIWKGKEAWAKNKENQAISEPSGGRSMH
jgi:hypothetical protein